MASSRGFLRLAIRLPARRCFAGGVSIDRRGLVNTLPPVIEESKLTNELRLLIESLGPLTVAEYMQHALQHPTHGYYTSRDSQIGKEGDFTTAPEISQIFGEAIGVWCVAVWTAMGAPPKFQLVEMGPGKGTLMADILRATKAFPRFREAATVHLVETSPHLRERQRKALGCVSAPASREGKEVERTLTPPPPQNEKKTKAALLAQLESLGTPKQSENDEPMHMKLPGHNGGSGGDVFWHCVFQDVPEEAGVPMLFVGQEILDALPVHQFELTKEGWRERLVHLASSADDDTATAAAGASQSPSYDLELELPFRFALSKHPTPAVTAYLEEGNKEQTTAASRGLSFEPTTWRAREKADGALQPTSSVAEEASALTSASQVETPAAAAEAAATAVVEQPRRAFPGAVAGDEVEVCPQGMALVQDLATRIARNRGAALLVDYGGNHAYANSLRGFHRHSQAHPLYRPGEVDLTYDVDFAALKSVVQRVEGCEVFGAVEQGWFLGAMGAPQRLEALLDRDDVSDDTAEALVGAYERLVDAGQMGESYKVMALVDAGQPGPPPGGFEIEEAEGTAVAEGGGGGFLK